MFSYNDVYDDGVGYVESGISQASWYDELHLLADQLPESIYSRVITDDGEASFLTAVYPDLDKNRRNYRDKKQCQDDVSIQLDFHEETAHFPTIITNQDIRMRP